MMHNLKHLYLEQLRDIYSAEKQLTEALPRMAQAAFAVELREAFEHHLDETRQHVQRLEQIFNALDSSPNGETCEAMQGIIREGEELIRQPGNAQVKDAALIAAAQRAEHYEIAAYGTVCAYAQQLSYGDAYRLLHETLDEEKDTDSRLTDLAKNMINKRAKTS
jgi:ferritin-like metal-binding protein YciE